MIKLKKQICFIYSQISEKSKSTNPNERKQAYLKRAQVKPAHHKDVVNLKNEGMNEIYIYPIKFTKIKIENVKKLKTKN